MKNEERISSLHKRMEILRQQQERRKTGALGAASAILTMCLFLLVFNVGDSHIGGAAGMYSGATMLFEGAGGYVLAAIIAFMAGVIVTAMIMKKKKLK